MSSSQVRGRSWNSSVFSLRYPFHPPFSSRASWPGTRINTVWVCISLLTEEYTDTNHRDIAISLLFSLIKSNVRCYEILTGERTFYQLDILLRSACILLYRHICYINNNQYLLILGLWSANLFGHQTHPSANFSHSCTFFFP